MTIETIRLPVRGMVCSLCVGHIMRAVSKLNGVENVSVDLRRETVTVTRRPALVTAAAIAAAIAGAGYEPDLVAATVLPAAGERQGILVRLGLRLPTP